MSLLLRKFSLGEKNFFSLGLCGKQVEFRLTSSGKTSLVLTPAELYLLNAKVAVLGREDVTYSSTINSFGESVERRCEFNDDYVRFVREVLTDAQPLSPSDNIRVEFTLEQASLQALVRFLPNIITLSEQIMAQEQDFQLAYDVIRDQIARLCEANGPHLPSHEHFLFIMRLLHQYVPVSFLVKDFTRRSKTVPEFNPYDIFKCVLYQYEHIYEQCYTH